MTWQHRSHHTTSWISVLASFFLGIAAVSSMARPVLVDDFEKGVGAWAVNDADHDRTGEEVRLCAITPFTIGLPEHLGEGAAKMVFRPSTKPAWASLSLAVDGTLWTREHCRSLSFWLRGDGSAETVEVVLRTIAPDGSEQKYATTVSLRDTTWHYVRIPFSRFRFNHHHAGNALSYVRLLQFVKRGTGWKACSFLIDDLKAEEESTPVKSPSGPSTPTPPVRPQPPSLPVESALTPGGRTETLLPVKVTVDFARAIGTVRTSMGMALAPEGVEALNRSEFLTRLTDLGPRIIRVRTSYFIHQRTDGNRAATFDYEAMDRAVVKIRQARAVPLICIDAAPGTSLDGAGFVQFARRLVQALNVERQRNVHYFEVFSEATLGFDALKVGKAVELADRVARELKRIDASIVVGGIGEPAPWRNNIRHLARSASRLQFFSFHFYGTHNASTTPRDLIQSALTAEAADLPDQLHPGDLAGLTPDRDLSPRWFITEAAPSSMRIESGASRDPRVRSPLAAAWVAALFSQVARDVDELLVYGAGDPSWGVLSPEGRPGPAYWGAWMVSTFFPAGSRIVAAESASPRVKAFAVRTPTAMNVLLIHAGDSDELCDLVVRNPGAIDMVRSRHYDSKSDGILYNGRPNEPEQKVRFQGYGVSVVQFIRPR